MPQLQLPEIAHVIQLASATLRFGIRRAEEARARMSPQSEQPPGPVIAQGGKGTRCPPG